MTDETRMTAIEASVGTDDRRSLNVCTGYSITEDGAEIKSFEELQREILRMADPSYLKTVSMTELFDNEYQSRPPVIDRLLYGICLMVVHHTRKQKADDAFDMISGTNGLMGATDGAFLLQKEKRTSNTATLEVSGRDQQDQRLYPH